MSSNVAVMTSEKLSRGLWSRFAAASALTFALIIAASSAQALTTVQFAPVREALSNEIATLSSVPEPTSQDLKRLRTLSRAAGVLTNASTNDGKALRSLLSALSAKNFPDYAPLLDAAATNLVSSYNKRFGFAAAIIPELPDSPSATLAKKQLVALGKIVAKLNAADRSSKVAAQIDAANRKLEALLTTVASALIPIFPDDLSPNTISAKVNGVNVRVSRDHASDNIFIVTRTETNYTIYVKAVDGTMIGGTGGRALVLSLTNITEGTYRYLVPDQATIEYHTGVYSGNEVVTTATSGNVFISTQGNEIFGVFTAVGPDLTISYGRFRLDLPTP